MDMVFRRIGHGGGLDLTVTDERRNGPVCARGIGRGSQVSTPSELQTLWFCLRGTLEIHTADGPFRLRRQQFLCLNGAAAVRAVGREDADWVVLSLPPAILAGLARSGDLRRLPDPVLFPTVLPFDRALLRTVVALLRQGPAADRAAVTLLIGDLVHAARQAQAPVQAWIDLASGRSERHRRQVVLRLLSPRNRILNEPFATQDLDSLAAAARYSKSHFLRMFRDVFGSTPHDLLIQSRMELAKRLIANSDLALSEVAASVGYESRYAFARLFKKRVGMTASDYRIDVAPDLLEAA
jgi:AraC family transcriptional regulator